MLPVGLLTVNAPLAMVHCAGERSLTETHSSRFRPSNRTIASEGGASFVGPGVTTFGTGVQTSVSSGLPFACAASDDAPTTRTANASDVRWTGMRDLSERSGSADAARS